MNSIDTTNSAQLTEGPFFVEGSDFTGPQFSAFLERIFAAAECAQEQGQTYPLKAISGSDQVR